MSNWGKAHINNTNGFGQAARNSTQGFGSVYDKSESGDTNLTGNPPYFAMTIDSTKPGSASDKFQFTGAVGEYDVDAVQNDEVVQSYTGLVDEQTITLPSAGIYQVRVKPLATNPFNQIKFDGGGDRNKVLSIDSFGIVQWSSFGSAFQGCENLTTSQTNPDLSIANSLFLMLGLNLNQNSNFIGDIISWDTSNVTSLNRFLNGQRLFNQDIGNWDTSSVTDMTFTFRFAESFKQDISNWNVEQVTTMNQMFEGVDMNIANTTTNYDNLLIKWSQQNVQQNVDFDAGDSKYNPSATLPSYSVTAGQAKQILVNNGWTITDGGQI